MQNDQLVHVSLNHDPYCYNEMFTASHVRCLFEDCGLKVLIPFSINLAPKDLVHVANTLQLGIEIINVKVFSLQKKKNVVV